jgi:hypothetical protein
MMAIERAYTAMKPSTLLCQMKNSRFAKVVPLAPILGKDREHRADWGT